MHAIPVANDDGTLFGMMSREDIASYNKELNNACVLDKVPLFNVLSVLEGKVINEAGEYLDTVSGEVILAIPESRGPSLFSNSNCVVICGNQPDLIRQALERNVNCLVLCRTELDPDMLKIDTKTCIISTPCDAYRATRLIFQSAPIGRMLGRKEELLTEMKEIAKKKGVSLIILMLTDVLMEGTHILYIGDDDVISQAFGVTPKENEVFLPKIMSRKKQIIPSLSALWG